MDQTKIGNFIRENRKLRNMTQQNLADELNISFKTVSKWECGNGLPDVSLMQPLCKILEIDINELLSGEKISKEEYKMKAENNFITLLNEKEKLRKNLIVQTLIIFIGISVLTIGIMLSALSELSLGVKISLLIFGTFSFIISLSIVIYIDLENIVYECSHCKTRFKPTTTEYVKARQVFNKRYLKCPHCEEKSYCRKRYM